MTGGLPHPIESCFDIMLQKVTTFFTMEVKHRVDFGYKYNNFMRLFTTFYKQHFLCSFQALLARRGKSMYRYRPH